MTLKDSVKKFIPPIFLRIYHFKIALMGAVIFGFPGKDKNMKIIGVTGTSGKSTTVELITRILDEAGKKVASISSIRFKMADKEWENKYKMTMPGRFVIQKFLKQAKNAGCKYAVLEVTSQGIEQFRHKFIDFDCAVFTNLTPEHIESHGGFENYRNEKLKLFKATKNIHVINADDQNAKYFLDIPARRKITFSLKDAEILNLNLKLPGEFNIYNALAAISVAKTYGIGFEFCSKALEKTKRISGRMEIVAESPIKVIVDYAHTPQQLEAAYKTFNPSVSFRASKLVCVLGSCGGGRDKWKRPVLGQLAEKYCNQIIITNEDPYDENPSQILSEIKSGITNNQDTITSLYEILDRKEAIKKAIELAEPGDVVIITGKGSEPWMCMANGKKIPWDDRKTAREALKGG